MEAILNDISENLFARPVNTLSVDELRSLVQEHPYAATLQLLLSQKLRDDSNHFAGQWQQTLLYYNDPLVIDRLFKAPSKSPPEGETFEPVAPPNLPGGEAFETVSIVETDFKTPVASEAPPPEGFGEAAEIKIPGLKIEPINPQQAAMAFMPYYTVDYFASQGIKLNENGNKEDNFGSQLKSFTDWLKEMRRLPEAHVKTTISFKQEKFIENMAQRSVSGDNVDTEAMALVWIQQGKPAMAIETYQKLSLQNPAKRAYFAAKIEHLKKSL